MRILRFFGAGPEPAYADEHAQRQPSDRLAPDFAQRVAPDALEQRPCDRQRCGVRWRCGVPQTGGSFSDQRHLDCLLGVERHHQLSLAECRDGKREKPALEPVRLASPRVVGKRSTRRFLAFERTGRKPNRGQLPLQTVRHQHERHHVGWVVQISQRDRVTIQGL